MAERQDVTLVSNLVGRITFNVSGGKVDAADYVPATKGFTIEVSYKNEAEKMGCALKTTAIAVQNVLRTFYRKHKRFPFQPGTIQKVDANGEFTLPGSFHIDKLEAQAAAGSLTRDDMLRLAKITGLQIPANWLTPNEVAETPEKPDEFVDAPVAKYEIGDLKRATVKALQVMAEEEGLDYEELTRQELIDELAKIETETE